MDHRPASTPPSSDRSVVSTDRVIRAVMLNQMLFTAGHSLTTGGFFTYFANSFHPAGLMLAALQIAPETSQSLSVLGRQIAFRLQNRKGIWISFLLTSRCVALLIPLALLWPEEDQSAAVLFILICTAIWYALQGIAFVNYISWLSDLVPDVNWGRLFSRRQTARILISLIVPVAASSLRAWWLLHLSESAERWTYGVIFGAGGALTMLSVIPLWSLPHVPWRERATRRRVSLLAFFEQSRSFRLLLASRWWGAFFQGLTQAVFIKFSIDILHISLTTYYVLASVMLLLQLPLAWWGGRLSDAFRDKQGLYWGLLVVSGAPLFWLLATPERWYVVFAAYALWGGFGLVNVCGENLCLKLSPRSDNASQFAYYDQVSGFIAGAAGLLGGFLLDRLMSAWGTTQELLPFQVLFLCSWLGRLAAPLWLVGVEQPGPREEPAV